jgi:hypothetical protein
MQLEALHTLSDTAPTRRKETPMSIVIRAFPLRRPLTELHALAATLQGQRSADTDHFYKRYGVVHESWHLQDTPAGPLVIGLTILDDPGQAAPRYASASDEFDGWFKGQVLHLTGVNPNETPLGPETQQVFSWSDKARLDTEVLAQLTAAI